MYNIFQSLDWPNMDNRADDLDIMTTMMILCFMTIVIYEAMMIFQVSRSLLFLVRPERIADCPAVSFRFIYLHTHKNIQM